MNSAIASAEPIAATAPRRRTRSPFYAGLAFLMIGLALAGFWPQYYSSVVAGVIPEPTRHPLIHLHSSLFLAWLLAFLVQATLIWRGRLALHRRLGQLLGWYGFAIAAVGLFAGFALAARFGRRLGDMEQAASFVFFPSLDMVYFAAFLAIALIWRNRPEVHRRAMLVATFSIAVVGMGRLLFPIGSAWIWQPLTLSPLLLAFGYDLLARRKIYPVLAVGLLVHWLRLNAEGFSASEAWRPIGRALIAPFA
jgi:hypothetical protein